MRTQWPARRWWADAMLSGPQRSDAQGPAVRPRRWVGVLALGWGGALAVAIAASIGWPAVALGGDEAQPPRSSRAESSPPVEQTSRAEPAAPDESGEPSLNESREIEELMRRMEEQRKKELEQLKADPTWQPSHEEVRVLRPCAKDSGEVLATFCIDADGRVLAGCYVPADEPSKPGQLPERAFKSARLRVFTPEGEAVASWALEVMPSAICVAPDGTIFVSGDGRVAKLSADGEVLAVADTPGLAGLREADAAKQREQNEREEAEKAKSETEDTDTEGETAKEQPGGIARALLRVLGLGGDDRDDAAAQQAAREAEAAWLRWRARDVTGLAATDADLFLCGGTPEGFGYTVWRMNHDLRGAEAIVKDLRGCCGQMDIQARGGELWIPVNGEHKVKCYDRDGQELVRFGKRDRKKAEGFGGCCEPKNLRIASDGSLYTAESGPPVVVKHFDRAGKFLGVVALPDYSSGCVRVTVALGADGDEVYLLDTGENAIHVFADRRGRASHEQTATLDFAAGERPTRLNAFCVGGDGLLYAGCGKQESPTPVAGAARAPSGGEVPPEVRVLDPDGKPLRAWRLDFTPQALAAVDDGLIVAGDGRLAHFDREGKLLLAADSPHVGALPPLPEIPDEQPLTDEQRKARDQRIASAEAARDAASKALAEKMAQLLAAKDDQPRRESLEKQYVELARVYAERTAEWSAATETPRTKALLARAARMRERSISAVAVADEDVYIACPMAAGFGFAVWRTDRRFGEGKRIVEGLRGCCGQMDIQARGDRLFVAENARKRVVVFDRDGKQLAAWGQTQRGGLEGFGSCCNPMNLRFTPAGELITSEASLGRLKRYSEDGRLLGLVGIAAVEGGCKNVAVDLSPDGSRFYVMDIGRQRICVLTAKPAATATP